ncbi:hypothetical protein EDB85DRAFT_1892397 [Lactarius pseudohatsudake]|nr:hypothetical protein EDB85DRAFT_1898516 [Lactarius pseudohatsudake]KAH9028789.1 hypothetical protein EDB85DRAFT_1892397 [Lactarius pseudohatsudake]
MAPKGIKASKVFQRKSKAKIIDWVSRKGSRGTRNIPVEVSTSTNLLIPRKDAGGREIDNHEAILHETDPPSMDIDETFWIEEPVIPEPKRSQHTYMEEFIPRIGPYLRCLLNSEGVPAMTMCQSCMSAPFEWSLLNTVSTTLMINVRWSPMFSSARIRSPSSVKSSTVSTIPVANIDHPVLIDFCLFLLILAVTWVVVCKANEGFLGIQLDPMTVDVNMHPTKHEVHFLEEEGITESIADAIQAKLAQSREQTFEYQTLLTRGIASADTSKGKEKVHKN